MRTQGIGRNRSRAEKNTRVLPTDTCLTWQRRNDEDTLETVTCSEATADKVAAISATITAADSGTIPAITIAGNHTRDTGVEEGRNHMVATMVVRGHIAGEGGIRSDGVRGGWIEDERGSGVVLKLAASSIRVNCSGQKKSLD